MLPARERRCYRCSPFSHSVSSLRCSHHVALQDAILCFAMNRAHSLLLSLLTACAAPSAGGGGDAVLAAQPSGRQLETGLSSIVLNTSQREGCRVVSLDLKNDSSQLLDFAWAVEWMDRAGEVIPGTPSAWRPMRLEAGTGTPIEFEAPHPQAASWRLIAIDLSAGTR